MITFRKAKTEDAAFMHNLSGLENVVHHEVRWPYHPYGSAKHLEVKEAS
jgi:hypothetical protein